MTTPTPNITTPHTAAAKNASAAADQATFALYQYFWIIDILMAILILVCGYLFLLQPKYQEIVNSGQLAQKQAEYTSKQSYITEMQKVEKIYKNIAQSDKDKVTKMAGYSNDKSDLGIEYNQILRNYRLTGIVETVAQPAAQPAIASRNNKPGPLGATRQTSATTITINSGLSYASFFKVIKAMETNLRIMDISKVDYDPVKQSAVLQVLTYQAK